MFRNIFFAYPTKKEIAQLSVKTAVEHMRTISYFHSISLFPIDHEITIDIGQFEFQISLLVERK